MKLDPDAVTVVMVRPVRSANVGAAARAMKTMGFTHLILVDPAAAMDDEARALAHGSEDVLAAARVMPTLVEALRDQDVVLGTTARRGQDRVTPLRLRRAVAEVLLGYLPARVAVVFGSEEAGLSNAELHLCHFAVEIPTAGRFHSLNLAQAVQVVCYELHESLGRGGDPAATGRDSGWPQEDARSEARRRRMGSLYRGLESFLRDVGFPDASPVERAMADARRVLGAAYLTQRDVNTVLGLFRHVRWLLRQKK